MQVVSAAQVAALFKDGDTVVIGGSGAGHAVPEALIEAVEKRFLDTGLPRGITSLHPVGIGDRSHRGVSRFAKPGLLKRIADNTISGKIAKDVFEAMLAGEGDADTIIKAKGLVQITDESAIVKAIEDVMAKNP